MVRRYMAKSDVMGRGPSYYVCLNGGCEHAWPPADGTRCPRCGEDALGGCAA